MPVRLVHLVFVLSGVAGLGYQIAWTRMFAPGLGHEVPSLLAVVAAFFGGFALGAWALDRPINRSTHPARWYALLEVVIGVWGLATIALIPLANRLVPTLTGAEPAAAHLWGVAFLVPFLTLLPATAAMGATLPAMERTVSALRAGGGALAGVYAANTFGAVIGTLASTYLLIPALGFRATVLVLVAANVASALLILMLARPAAAAAEPVSTTPPPLSRGALILALVATGLLGIGFEVLAVRVMAQVLENTVYSYASGLSVYLIGTALGAAVYQRLGRRFAWKPTLATLLGGLSIAVSVGILVLAQSGRIYDGLSRALAGGLAGSVAAELTLAAFVFLPATLFMGATFSHLAEAAGPVFRRPGAVGTALAWNTLGGAFASLAFVVVLLPSLGPALALVVIAVGYALLILLGGVTKQAVPPAIIGLIVAGIAATSDLRLVQPLAGGRVITHRDGVLGATAIVTDAQNNKTLKINNKFMQGGVTGVFIQRRQGHLPLLLHPAPTTALFLGLGSGSTFDAAGEHPGLRATAVELVPEVVELLPQFNDINPVLADPRQDRLRVRVADARRYVGATRERYDVIVADLFHPARDGAGSLYTREHFAAIRERLAPGGLFCQWLPLYQLDEPTLRTVIRTFLDVFPHTTAWLGSFNVGTPTLALIGTLDPQSPRPSDYFINRVTDRALESGLNRVALRDSLTLLGGFMADADALRAWAGPGPLNTDDFPLVTFAAPRYAYRLDQTSYSTLMAMLSAVPPNAALAVNPGEGERGERTLERFARFLEARNVFLIGAIDMAEGRTDDAIVRYLDSARISRDFLTGFESALAHARTLMTTDGPAAETLLKQLDEAVPGRRDVAQALEQVRGLIPRDLPAPQPGSAASPRP